MMRSIQNTDTNLQEIVKNICNNKYLIPKFQRPFVWSSKGICDLGDSIIRGYPISSLLTMPANGTLQVDATVLVKNNTITAPYKIKQENQDKIYILDGQQRITAISKIFLNSDSKKEYYFDLLAILVENFSEDCICDNTYIKNNLLKSKITDSLCRFFDIATDKDERPTRGNHRFISGKAVISDKSGSIINKFLRHFTNHFAEDKIDRYTDHLNAVLNSTGSYSVPETQIYSNTDLAVVIRVFEKVNSTGIKLTLFDLINAKSFKTQKEEYKGGLFSYLNKEIKKKITENNNIRIAVNDFFGYNPTEDIFKRLGIVIRVFETYQLFHEDKFPNIFKSAMLRRNADFWFNTWREKVDVFIDILCWLSDEGLTKIGQNTFLEYVIAIFIANQKAFEAKSFRDVIKKHAMYLTLTNTVFTKSNLEFVDNLYKSSKLFTTTTGMERYRNIEQPSKLNLNGDKILATTSSTKPVFNVIRIMLYKDNIGSYFTRDLMGNKIKSDLIEMDHHHIYPKSRVYDFKTNSIFNSIANTVFIDSTLNRVDIKDKLPNEYFQDIKSMEKSSFNCKQNLIEIDEICEVNSEEKATVFIKKRAEKIADLINEYF